MTKKMKVIWKKEKLNKKKKKRGHKNKQKRREKKVWFALLGSMAYQPL